MTEAKKVEKTTTEHKVPEATVSHQPVSTSTMMSRPFDTSKIWIFVVGFFVGIVMTLVLGSLWAAATRSDNYRYYEYEKRMPRMMEDGGRYY